MKCGDVQPETRFSCCEEVFSVLGVPADYLRDPAHEASIVSQSKEFLVHMAIPVIVGRCEPKALM